jgi:hypothetical protein
MPPKRSLRLKRAIAPAEAPVDLQREGELLWETGQGHAGILSALTETLGYLDAVVVDPDLKAKSVLCAMIMLVTKQMPDLTAKIVTDTLEKHRSLSDSGLLQAMHEERQKILDRVIPPLVSSSKRSRVDAGEDLAELALVPAPAPAPAVPGWDTDSAVPSFVLFGEVEEAEALAALAALVSAHPLVPEVVLDWELPTLPTV